MGGSLVAIDGKTLRRFFDRAAAASPLHQVSAWAADQRLVLGQLAVGDKSNEIVAVPKLLELSSLKGRIVTADAMSCQRKIAQQVIDQGADYVLALKGRYCCKKNFGIRPSNIDSKAGANAQC